MGDRASEFDDRTTALAGTPVTAGYKNGKKAMLRVTGRAAGVAQLAEHNVANVVVVGSNPITRSNYL